MANIKDVAKACGVSPATVSYVLNNKRVLKQETRDRVWRAIHELDYHPSEIARGLSLKRMRTIGVVFGFGGTPQVTADTYLSVVLQGILDAASAAELNVTIFTSPWHGAARSAPVYRDQRADGIVVVAPPTDSDFLEGLSKVGVPLVAIAADTTGYDVTCVDVDNSIGTEMAMRHLYALGHRKIAHFAGNGSAYNAQTRLAAYHQFVADNVLVCESNYVQFCTFDGAGVIQAMNNILALHNRPTAILAANDTIAFQIISVCRGLGISVPDQLSVVGFDGGNVGAISYPPLTTVLLPIAELGKHAVRLLLQKKGVEDALAKTVLLSPSLLVRDSTAEVRD